MDIADGSAGALRLVAYLIPTIPADVYAVVADAIARATGGPVEVIEDGRRSGPEPDEDPFSTGAADLALVCAPSWCWLRTRQPATARLVGFAPAPADPRSGGRAQYFSEVVVAREHPAVVAGDLDGARWAVNDQASLSGYHSVLNRVRRPRIRWSGAHRLSAEMVCDGRADAAAIDALAWRLLRRERPDLAAQLRVVTSWGPHPTQPMVASTRLPSDTIGRIGEALAALTSHPVLADAGLAGFAPVDDRDYARPWNEGVAPPRTDTADTQAAQEGRSPEAPRCRPPTSR